MILVAKVMHIVMTQAHARRFCGFAMTDSSLEEIKDSIILSHWGLTTYESPCTLQERLDNFNHCSHRAAIDAGQSTPSALPCFVPGKVRDNTPKRKMQTRMH